MRRCPRLVFDTSEPEDLVSYAEALPKLAGIFRIPAPWARERLHIPEPADGEEVLGSQPARVPGAPPVTPKDALAALVANASAGSADPTPVTALAGRLSSESTGAWRAVLAHIESLVDSAESLEELQVALLAAYDGLPLDDLRAVMASGFMVARLAGMADVGDEAAASGQR